MFDRAYLINLMRRPDRLENFYRLKALHGWELPEPTIFSAVDGDKVGVPGYFSQGGGAWGCLRSHCRILETCVMEDVGSVLVLEDDATWTAEAWARLEAFLAVVPGDWEQLMLGGQVMASETVCPGVVRACARGGIQRTHAYAVRGPAMKSLLSLWYAANVHIDWKMGEWQPSHKVYAPDPFVFGQAGGKSDISGRTNPPYWWGSAGETQRLSATHVLVFRGPREVVDNLRGFHRGYWLHASGQDNGLVEISTLTGAKRAEKLAEWLRVVGGEAAAAGCVPLIWHPALTVAEVETAAAGRRVVEIAAEDAGAALAQWEHLLHISTAPPNTPPPA